MIIKKIFSNPCKIFDILDQLYVRRNLGMTIILNFSILSGPLMYFDVNLLKCLLEL